MTKEFKYCENPEAVIPKMFIDNEIGGKNADGDPNIQGNDFLKELMYLSDTENKPKIEIWINSPGGIVTDGQSIYASILQSVATVDTICYGIAASIAGVIFQAGRKRKMFDYATLMYHPAYSEDGKVDKGLEALNNAICKMVAKRTGKTEDEIWAIMNRGRANDKGTWISAEEALANGFCDEIIHSDSKNKNAVIGENTISVWKSANLVLNRVIENKEIKKPQMSKILNKALGLNEEASEASAVAALDVMNKSMEDLKQKYDKKKQELADLKAEMDKMKADKAKADDEAKAKAEEEMKAKAEADKMDAEKKADDGVKALVTDGKIKNDAEVVKKWKAMFVSDFKGTSELAESLPVNKKSPDFVPSDDAKIEDSEAEQMARKAGHKPGTANWYNAVKSYQITAKK